MLTKDEAAALQDLGDSLKEVRNEIRARPASGPRASATVQSSAPMWVCVVAVAGLIGYSLAKDGEKDSVLIQQQAQILRLERKLDRVEDYQLTTYMLIPDLRKLVETKANEKEQ